MPDAISSSLPAATSLVLLVCLLVLRLRRGQGRTRRPSLAWWAVFVAIQAALCVWSLRGLVRAPMATLALEALVALASGSLALGREGVLEGLDQAFGSRGGHAGLTAALLVTASLLADFALEVPFNDWIGGQAPFALIPFSMLLEVGLVLLASLALYFLGQGHGALPALVVPVAYLIGLAEYFVQIFKSAAILPSDVLSVGTAAAVSGGYDYTLLDAPVKGLCYALLALACYALVRPGRRHGHEGRPARLALNLALALAMAGGLYAALVAPSYAGDLGLKIEYWYSMDSYRRQGFLPSFVTVAQDLPIRRPQGYTPAGADGLERDLAASWDADALEGGASSGTQDAQAQFAQARPSIVVVQNETFSDLSDFQGLRAGYDGPQYFKNGITDALARGDLYLSAQGGGTCNTEFSLLTGYSLAYIGAGKYPYTMYDFDKVDSVVSQLGAMGYQTTAIHPNLASNWRRNLIYAQMGFDRFLTTDNAFQGAQEYHAGVSDAETYAQVLSILSSSDQPQFVWDVTMQNHSGYDIGNIPAEDLPGLEPQGVDDEALNAQLNEYLACIRKSDEALEDFMDQLRALDRPVILVFYGDHQPSLTAFYNDAFYGKDESPLIHVERLYHTQYVIWANYDVAGRDQASRDQTTSVSYLAAQTLDLAGASLTPYQKAQLALSQDMPVLNIFGYQDTDGVWHPTSTSTDLASSETTTVAADEAEAPVTDANADTEAARQAKGAYEALAWLQYRNFAERLQR